MVAAIVLYEITPPPPPVALHSSGFLSLFSAPYPHRREGKAKRKKWEEGKRRSEEVRKEGKRKEKEKEKERERKREK